MGNASSDTASTNRMGLEATRFWQIALVVPRLEAAMAEFADALGLDWTAPRDLIGIDGKPLRAVLSRQGPPYFELIEGSAESRWHSEGGTKFDHIAYWVDDITAERHRLERVGVPVIADGQADGRPINFHELPCGVRIELMGSEYKDRMRHGSGLDDAGRAGKGEARQRGHDHIEGIRTIATETLRMGQAVNELPEVPERPRPSVRQDNRHRIRTRPALVHEMHPEPVDIGDVVPLAIQLRFLGSPIEAVPPVVDERLQLARA
jgi:hypothetical protein